MNYQIKYLKYKTKYYNLKKNQFSGANPKEKIKEMIKEKSGNRALIGSLIGRANFLSGLTEDTTTGWFFHSYPEKKN